ncbi:hypothetical protein C475_09209 [Halosimplex carlsbadense 2-9-1]|uniref:Uncharacterized protein n=1 Tax=Halosimplex carlsbadense 2-9-1 TaxID=797114 RepID=M0CQU6_9EURY|nr:hypothetical protein [Halosimplex carlsbadense]ELZ25625.1 hypothetical protein C475_09209 [Halosimplex carlsbadense 2-9-1]
MPARDPSFAIPGRPERTYPRGGGVEYEGETVFVLSPAADRSDGDLEALVTDVLDADSYRSGDFMELPMPLYLVRDEETADVFRVTVRNRAVQLHVLPETESEGLRRFYERLREASDCEWSVACRTDFG